MRLRFTFLGAVALAMTAAPALAQNNLGAVEEIVVTARKLGAERLQDVPVTVTAITEDTLRDMQVLDFEDFAYQVPGLSFIDAGPGQRRYVIRGIQSAGQQQVAVYYDEVPLPGIQSSSSNSGSQTTDLKLFDMQRIEALRGPQGTTFGANSQSGTMRFITAKPDLEAFSATLGGQLGQTAHSNDYNWSGHGVVNLPLSDTLGMRLVAYNVEDAGWLENNRCRPVDPAEDPRDPGVELACLNLKDFNYIDTRGLRANVLWQPSETFSLNAQYWWQDRYLAGDNRYHPYDTYDERGVSDNGDMDRVAGFTHFHTGEFLVGDYAQTFKPDEQNIFSLTGDLDLGFATLTATASRYERDFEFKFDSTWIITFLYQNNSSEDFNFFTERADLIYALTDQRQSLDQNHFEVRLTSAGESALQWVGGVFWRERNSDFQSFVPVINSDGLTFDPGTPFTIPPTSEPGAGIPGCHPCVFARFADKDITEQAVFADASYQLNDQWELGVGIRWFKVEVFEIGDTVFNFAAFAPNPPDGRTDELEIDDDEITTKVVLRWQPNEELTIYGTRAEGYRLGGTNNPGIINNPASAQAGVPPLFEADKVTSYEIGVKSQWLGGAVQWNNAAFWMTWENLQVAAQDPTGAFNFIGNAGEAEVTGVETELLGRFGNLDLTAALTYLGKRELTEDQVSESVRAPGLAGDTIPRIPELTASFAAQYNFQPPITGWDAFVRIEGSHKGDSWTQLRPTAGTNRYQDSFNLFNARLGFGNGERALTLQLYIENLTDEQPDLFINAANGQPTSKITSRPRTVGLSVTQVFGG
ncbi:MAG: TonB-dependent receptor [Gammaproteobacteria bacterium]|nr:TonB-dependent receptor [Gammaproteobacteria bacterium]MXW46902.1 TonB-dependent receptor plug domain-containing protein [Gammaproteobacteria bacterium]MYD02166.1 TonB-dependent receptor plug domain-containing protein [Gammaproteobacteria bacterium]MYI24369.1 TonB-dependent receptor plug domain-containing protein [Gammaproteobacteria bacterium]